MYKDHFRLGEMPFSIAPDPRFLFMSERHREALAHLLFGVKGEGGIVLLTGEVGTGKTTICRSLLDQLPENIDVAFILNPRMNVDELLQTICEEFHIEIEAPRPGIKIFIDALNAKLLAAHAQGRSAILIVDEAQNLDPEVLEQLRLLTNLETGSRKLLQIFLIGQPELQLLLSRPEMRQVSQRVIARYHLTNLSQSEVKGYIQHRLQVSGASPLIFPEKLIKEIYRASSGVPRLINLICDRALLGAYTQGTHQINLPVLRQAIKEIFATRPRKPLNRIVIAGLSTLVTCLVILLAMQFPETKIFEILPGGKDSQPKATSVASTQASDTLAANNNSATSAVSNVPSNNLTTIPAIPLKWPSDVPIMESETLAFQSLFKRYGFEIMASSKDTPCQQAQTHGMHCFFGHGGLTDLVQLDQPVLTRLTSAEGTEYSATLVALDKQSATLMVADREIRVSLMELANAWYGQYIVIWQAPPGFNGQLTLDDRGPAVRWLRHALEIIDGIADNGSDIFDAPLAQRIHTFQLTDGIQPDAVLGPFTVIRLNARSGKGGPAIINVKKG